MLKTLVKGQPQEQEVLSFIEKNTEGRQLHPDRGSDREGRRVHGPILHQPRDSGGDPIYVANFVLFDYGTGAIMAVPPTTRGISSSPKSIISVSGS